MKAKKSKHRLASYNPRVDTVRTIDAYDMTEVSLEYWLGSEEHTAWLEDVSFAGTIISGGHNWSPALGPASRGEYVKRYNGADTYKATK